MAMTNKQKLDKLCNIRTDLSDDSSHILTINTAIQSVADNFDKLFSYSNSSFVRNKIEELKEPVQTCDSNLKNAVSYCQYEINNICAIMKKDNGGGAGGGGGRGGTGGGGMGGGGAGAF